MRSDRREQEAELTARLDAVEEERRQVLEAARQQAHDELEALRGEVDQLRRRLAAAAQPLQVVAEIGDDLDELEDQVAEPVARAAPPVRAPLQFHLGQRVLLPALQTTGVVTELGGEQVEVQIGRLRVRARASELALPGEVEEALPVGPKRYPGSEARQSVTPEPPPFELDLRGMTVDEALEELERRLDAASYAGLPFVRIIHGKGTGRLRQAIRESLRSNPYAATFQSGSEAEGGDGVTVVHLRQG